MSGTLKHKFVSTIANGSNASQAQPSNWNDEHAFAGGVAGNVLVRDTGATDGASWTATPSLTTLTLTGQLKAADGTAGAPSITFASDTTKGLYSNASNQIAVTIGNTARVTFTGSGINNIQDTGTYTMGSAADVVLARDAAGVLAQRNGTNAQTLRVYNTFTDASNYARVALTQSGLIQEQAGTGSSATFILGTSGGAALNFRTNNNDRWQVAVGGALLAFADNTYDIGAIGATRARTIYFATSLVGPFSSGIDSAGSAFAAGGSNLGWFGRTLMTSPSDGTATFRNQAGTSVATLTLPVSNTTATIPYVVGTTGLLSAQGANIATVTVPGCASVAAGFYQVSVVRTVTRAASTSSTAPSVTLTWNNGTAAFAGVQLLATNAGNTTGSSDQTSFVIHAGAATAIQYATTGYVTSGATSMQYELYVTVRAIY